MPRNTPKLFMLPAAASQVAARGGRQGHTLLATRMDGEVVSPEKGTNAATRASTRKHAARLQRIFQTWLNPSQRPMAGSIANISVKLIIPKPRAMSFITKLSQLPWHKRQTCVSD